MKKVLFIDRDGTLVIEPPVDYQLDSFEKLEFYPKVMRNLYFIRRKLDFEFVMVTNQDGLGTEAFPEHTFWGVHNLVMKTLEGGGGDVRRGVYRPLVSCRRRAHAQAAHGDADALYRESGL